MGITAENLADKYGIDRAQQDAFAAQSQQRAAAAIESGRFDAEITPVMIPQRKGDPVAFARDEQPRAGTTAESSAACVQPSSRRTAASPPATPRPQRRRRRGGADERQQGRGPGLPVLAKIAGYANAGVDPAIMGIGPVTATRRCSTRPAGRWPSWT